MSLVPYILLFAFHHMLLTSCVLFQVLFIMHHASCVVRPALSVPYKCLASCVVRPMLCVTRYTSCKGASCVLRCPMLCVPHCAYRVVRPTLCAQHCTHHVVHSTLCVLRYVPHNMRPCVLQPRSTIPSLGC